MAPPTSVSSCDDTLLPRKSQSSDNAQSRATGGLDGSLTSAPLLADCSLLRSFPSVAGQNVSMAATAKILHEKQCSPEAAVFADVAGGIAFPSRVKSAMEGLSFCDDAVAASPPCSPPRWFSDLENENPCSARVRRGDIVQSLAIPRAPIKPAGVRSFNSLIPGKTRRRLDFDHL